MNRTMLLAGLAMAVGTALPVVGESTGFVRLAPGADIPNQACPIRVELPLDQLFSAPNNAYRSGRAAKIVCNGAYLQLIDLAYLPSRNGLKPHVHVSTHVAAHRGMDKIVTIDYSLVQGEQVIGTGGESIPADEGETNWEDGADIWFNAENLDKPVALRLEATVVDNP